MNTTRLLETTLERLFSALMKLTNYKVAKLPSLRKTIDPFSPTLTYGEVLDYFVKKSDEISGLEEFIRSNQKMN